jgi:DNA-binding response OmpR family regulator
MGDGPTKPSSYRFASFELDTRSGELRKNGTRIRLQDQPQQILLLLLEHSGEVVTREQIQHKLWPPDTYVDYDNAINSAMRKLREALGDDSGDPSTSRQWRGVGTGLSATLRSRHSWLPNQRRYQLRGNRERL